MRYLKKFNENVNFKSILDNLFIDIIDRGASISVYDELTYCDILNPKFIDSDITTISDSEPAYHHILNLALKDRDTQYRGVCIQITGMKGDLQDIECIKFANDYLNKIGYEFKHIYYANQNLSRGRGTYYSNDIDSIFGRRSVHIVYKLY